MNYYTFKIEQTVTNQAGNVKELPQKSITVKANSLWAARCEVLARDVERSNPLYTYQTKIIN